MKEIEVGGKTFKVKELKRKEVKAWRKRIMDIDTLQKDNQDHMDAYLEACLGPEDALMLDELTQKEFKALFDQAHALTFGDKEAEKNS